MNQATGFSASDAERQAAESAENYLNRAMRMLASRCQFERMLESEPATFAENFGPILAALIEAQAREFQSWTLAQGLESLAATHGRAVDDLAAVLNDRLKGIDDSLFVGMGQLAARWEDENLFRFRQELTLPPGVAERQKRTADDGDN